VAGGWFILIPKRFAKLHFDKGILKNTVDR